MRFASPRRVRALTAPLAVLVAIALVWDRHPWASSERTGEAVVARVVDGDTVAVRLGERVERVRYIGVDTPETKRPGTPIQCFGKAASARNGVLVGGERVRLRFDAERRDRYGRLLAYVYRRRDGLFVNAALVREGFATTLTIPPNVRHAALFSRLEREAREHDLGLWRACG